NQFGQDFLDFLGDEPDLSPGGETRLRIRLPVPLESHSPQVPNGVEGISKRKDMLLVAGIRGIVGSVDVDVAGERRAPLRPDLDLACCGSWPLPAAHDVEGVGGKGGVADLARIGLFAGDTEAELQGGSAGKFDTSIGTNDELVGGGGGD